MGYPNLREIVQTVLNNHPKDCIFEPNALEAILDELKDLGGCSADKLIDAMIIAIQRQEIYCPHEGIDRREK